MESGRRFVFPERPHLVEPNSGLAVWFTDPPGIVTQLGGHSHLTIAMATFLAGSVHERMVRTCGAATEGFVYLHDWSRGTGYEPTSRLLLTSYCLRHRRRIKRIVLVLSESVSMLVKMGTSVATASLQVAGLRLEVSHSAERSLAETQQKPLAVPI